MYSNSNSSRTKTARGRRRRDAGRRIIEMLSRAAEGRAAELVELWSSQAWRADGVLRSSLTTAAHPAQTVHAAPKIGPHDCLAHSLLVIVSAQSPNIRQPQEKSITNPSSQFLLPSRPCASNPGRNSSSDVVPTRSLIFFFFLPAAFPPTPTRSL